MKCFLVVNQLNDPFYIDYDPDFGEYIISRAKEKGLLEHDAEGCEIDANMVMQLFSPLVLSQWLLIDQTREPCSAIHCPNGFCLVFKHVDDLLFLTINGDGTEDELFLHRKIQVFIRLMRFMFGPVSEEIGYSHLYSKKAKWDFLRQLTKSWAELVNTEQAFLVEAIEKLHVNQVVSEKCVEILEWSVKQIQAVRDLPTQHAILLVNSKLAAMFSNRSAHELRPKDVLSLMVLAKTLYPRSDRLEDLFSKPHAHTAHTKKSTSSKSTDENSDGGDDEYHSAPATPSEDRRSRASSVKSSDSRTTEDKFDLDLGIDGALEAPVSEENASSSRLSTGSLLSVSESETVCVASSDGESTEKAPPQDKSSTLLQMYFEKYPNSVFAKESAENIVSTSVDKSLKKRGLSILTGKKGDLVEREESKDGEMFKEKSRDAASGHVLEKEKTDSSYHDAPEVESKDSCSKLHSRPSSAGTEGTKSRASTSSSSSELVNNPSKEPDVASLFSIASRTSSAISNMSKSYPELSAHDNKSLESESILLSRNEQETTTSTTHIVNKTRAPKEVTRIATEGSVSTQDSSQLSFETVSSSVVTSDGQNRPYQPQTVFLETSTCLYSPYNIHSAQVLPGVTMLLLSQAPRHSLADSLFQVIHNIQDLIYGRRIKLPRSRSLYVYDIINSLLGKLHNSLKKYKGRVRNLSYEIHARWEKDDLKHKLLDFLEKDARTPIPPELESPLLELYKKLRELFAFLFLSPLPSSPHLWEAIAQLRVRVNSDLLDYREYLNVKAQRNITMTSYIEEFPGLVHFIFIDRRFHRMTAPSLNISLKEGESVDATSYLKDKIWKMYQHMMQKLTEGYTTVILREGDFHFSYFLWFEDYTGNPLPVQESFKPSKKFPYPGILSGSFYRDLLQHCFPHAIQGSVHCFEMFLMHLGTVHPQYIAMHCKHLAHKMWEMSGDSFSPINLF